MEGLAFLFAGVSLALFTVVPILIGFYVFYYFKPVSWNIHLQRSVPFLVSLLIGLLLVIVPSAIEGNWNILTNSTIPIFAFQAFFTAVFFIFFYFLIFIKFLIQTFVWKPKEE
jgi:hypothetical protein